MPESDWGSKAQEKYRAVSTLLDSPPSTRPRKGGGKCPPESKEERPPSPDHGLEGPFLLPAATLTRGLGAQRAKPRPAWLGQRRPHPSTVRQTGSDLHVNTRGQASHRGPGHYSAVNAPKGEGTTPAHTHTHSNMLMTDGEEPAGRWVVQEDVTHGERNRERQRKAQDWFRQA